MRLGCVCLAVIAMALPGCDDMTKQRKPHPYRTPAADPARLPPGTVQTNDAPLPPPRLTLALIERGQTRFQAFCVPCHSQLGDGRGMVVQRGFSPPPSYHIARLRDAPTLHFFDVMTNGYGAMYSFAQRIPPQDRWAIAAYIRSLQRSETATPAELSPAERTALDTGRPEPTPAGLDKAAPWSVGVP